MMNNYISLREYINRRDMITSIKVRTFCKLMKKVSQALDECDANALIRVNLDEILIDINTGHIKFNEEYRMNVSDKTMVDMNTGVGIMTERKSSKEHQNISFALMFLGWYVNDDEASIPNDIQVVEHFDEYMEKVPEWLHNFFISIFKQMNYNESFTLYYDKNFTDKVNDTITDAANSMDLNGQETKAFGRFVTKLLGKKVRGK